MSDNGFRNQLVLAMAVPTVVALVGYGSLLSDVRANTSFRQDLSADISSIRMQVKENSDFRRVNVDTLAEMRADLRYIKQAIDDLKDKR